MKQTFSKLVLVAMILSLASFAYSSNEKETSSLKLYCIENQNSDYVFDLELKDNLLTGTYKNQDWSEAGTKKLSYKLSDSNVSLIRNGETKSYQKYEDTSFLFSAAPIYIQNLNQNECTASTRELVFGDPSVIGEFAYFTCYVQ